MIGVDVGGSFTDLVAIRDGAIHTAKVSTSVGSPHQAVLEGAERLTVSESSVFNHASTHGLNAIITRRLPKVAFLTTFGHRDMLDAGRVRRPVEGLTDPRWRRSFGDASRPLVPRYLRRGIKERLTSDGSVLIDLDETQARAELQVLNASGVQGLAICLLHSYVSDVHEKRLREIAREVLGDIPISISSEVSPLAKEYPRASTTVVDVFMKFIYTDYTEKLDEGLRSLGFTGDLNFADGAANLLPAENAIQNPYKIVFSGPAAGTVASAHFGKLIETTDLLCADIGGTSCDISVVTGAQPYVNTTIELEDDLIVNTLSNEISAIGAGGGSTITINNAGDLLVGPGSAGADPGPACYGKGGEDPTTTDIYLLMGIIDGENFAGGSLVLDADLAHQAVDRLDSNLSFEQRVSFAYHIGLHNIAEGLTNVAVSHGIDPRDYSLIAYGAAGPMLLPATLELTKIKEIIVPPHPGLFSALGLVSSDLVYATSRSGYHVLADDVAGTLTSIYDQMEEELRAAVPADQRESLAFERTFDGRLVGQSWETPFVPAPAGEITGEGISQMIQSFHDTYNERSGNRFEFIPVQAATYRVQAVAPMPKVEYPELPSRATGEMPKAEGTTTINYLTDVPLEADVYERSTLMAGDEITGPAIIREPLSTTFVVRNQRASVGRYGEIRIRQL